MVKTAWFHFPAAGGEGETSAGAGGRHPAELRVLGTTSPTAMAWAGEGAGQLAGKVSPRAFKERDGLGGLARGRASPHASWQGGLLCPLATITVASGCHWLDKTVCRG